MILSDKMIQTALDLYKAEPWNNLKDGDVFAIKLSANDTAYCMATQGGAERFGFTLHKTVDSLLTHFETGFPDLADTITMLERLSHSDNITCCFEKEDSLYNEEREATETYISEHKIEQPLPFGWPRFIRANPGKVPFAITTEQDADDIVAAIKAVTYLAKQESVDAMVASSINHQNGDIKIAEGSIIPLLTPQQDGSYEISKMELPETETMLYPETPFENEALAHRLLALPKNGLYQCRGYFLPYHVQNGEGEAPSFSEILALMELKSGLPLVVEPGKGTQDMLKNLGNQFVKLRMKPASIIVADERTRCLLADFCKQCRITLRMQPSLDCLELTFRQLFDKMFKEKKHK